MKVHEAMTVDVLTVTPESTLKEAAVRMGRCTVSPGCRSSMTTCTSSGSSRRRTSSPRRATASRGGGMFRWLLDPDPTWSSRAEAITVEDAMSAPPLTTTPNRSVAAAATAMLDEGVNRLPVVDEEGVLVGLISRGDLVRHSPGATTRSAMRSRRMSTAGPKALARPLPGGDGRGRRRQSRGRGRVGRRGSTRAILHPSGARCRLGRLKS